jgi:flavodoxin
LLPIADAGDASDYERIIIGYWVDKGDANEEALQFIAKLKNKTLGIFTTLGGNPDSEHAQNALNRVTDRLTASGNTVKATFKCRGAVAPKLIERIKATWDTPPPPDSKWPAWTEAAKEAKLLAWAEAAKHPNGTDFANAQAAFAAF